MLRATLNLANLNNSANGQQVLAALKGSPKIGGFLNPLLSAAGIDMTRLSTLAVGVNDKPPKGLLIGLRGDFEPGALLDAVTSTQAIAKAREHAGVRAAEIPGKALIAALDGGIFLSVPPTMEGIIDAHAAGKRFSDKELGAIVAESAAPDASHDLSLRWDEPRHDFDTFGAKKRPPNADKMVAIDADLDVHPELSLSLRVVFSDEAAAQETVGQSSAMLNAPAPGPLAAMGVKNIGDHVRIQRSGPEIEIKVTLPQQITLAALGMLKMALTRV